MDDISLMIIFYKLKYLGKELNKDEIRKDRGLKKRKRNELSTKSRRLIDIRINKKC
jgi:hypothetical protein